MQKNSLSTIDNEGRSRIASVSCPKRSPRISPLRPSRKTRLPFYSRSWHSNDVVSVLEELADERGLPEKIQVDNGPEFASKSLDLWAYLNGVQLDFSRPGKPTDNAVIESFNGKFREECLNQSWFLSLEEAKYKIELWSGEYNEVRPRSAMASLAPSEFAVSSGQMKQVFII